MKKYSVYKITNCNDNGIYYGQTNDFARRSEEHIFFIKNKSHPNKNILKVSKKYHWTDFEIEEIEKFDSEKRAKMKEEKLIIKALNNHNLILYNEKIPLRKGENLMMSLEFNLAKKFLEYKRQNNLNKSELARKIFKNYFSKKNPKITWDDQSLKNKDKISIGVKINNDFIKKIHNYSEVKEKNKNIIYHSAVESYLEK